MLELFQIVPGSVYQSPQRCRTVLPAIAQITRCGRRAQVFVEVSVQVPDVMAAAYS